MGKSTSTQKVRYYGPEFVNGGEITVRQDEAWERQRDRALRSNAEQIAVLDERLGEGVGAVKERARLGLT
jgi:hypothetical protein